MPEFVFHLSFIEPKFKKREEKSEDEDK